MLAGVDSGCVILIIVGVCFVALVPYLPGSVRSVQGRSGGDGGQGEDCGVQPDRTKRRLRAVPEEDAGVLQTWRIEGMGVCTGAGLPPLRQIHRARPARLCTSSERSLPTVDCNFIGKHIVTSTATNNATASTSDTECNEKDTYHRYPANVSVQV